MAATLARLKSLWVSGEVGPDTPVWTEGMPTRTRVRDVPSLLKSLPGASRVSPLGALLSDDMRWETGGQRHRAAVAAAAAGEVSPSLVLDLLRELKAVQGENLNLKASIENLSSQRRLLMDDKRRVRQEEGEDAREIALALAEQEAKDLVQELRRLVLEEKHKTANREKKENAIGRLRGRNRDGGVGVGASRGTETVKAPKKAPTARADVSAKGVALKTGTHVFRKGGGEARLTEW
jgi:phosphoribosyl-ATP pyrophosphohydrolase